MDLTTTEVSRSHVARETIASTVQD